METIQATQFATRLKDWKEMTDYSKYLLEINQQMKDVHKYAQANNFKIASEAAMRVAKLAMSLSALLEVKTEMEI
jgi:soluble cytochrome b562